MTKNYKLTGLLFRQLINLIGEPENFSDKEKDILYIKENVTEESKTYTLINDLSHGGWRTEQAPIHDDDFILV